MRRRFVIDFETHLIRPGVKLPRPVCAGVLWQGEAPVLLLAADALDEVERALLDPDVEIVNHNLGFDLGVTVAERPHLLPLVLDAYDEGRARCTMIRQVLIDISRGEAATDDARGKKAFRRENAKHWDFTQGPLGVQRTAYGLDDLVRWYYNEHLEKAASPRESYGDLDGLPLSMYTEYEREYPKRDTTWASAVFDGQSLRMLDLKREVGEVWEAPDGEIPNELEQCIAAFDLQLMQARGLRTDPDNVFALAAHFEETKRRRFEELGPSTGLRPDGRPRAGFIREDGSKDTKIISLAMEEAYEAIGEPVPQTPTGRVSLAGDALVALKSSRPDFKMSTASDLVLLGEGQSEITTVNTWLPWLQTGITIPICPSYWPLVASGRLSAREPNVTNPPRKGDIRPCVRARPGFALMSADFDTAEMRSHAQNCLELLGWSDLAEAFRRGEDPHLSFAADQLGLDYAEAKRRYDDGDMEVDAARQWAKVPDFGFPGGLGVDGFVEYAAGYGYIIDPKEARRTKSAFEKKWRENPPYFELVGRTIADDGIIQQLFSKRVRGGVGFTDGCNCVDFETEALTKRGWVGGRDLRITDEVLTKNATTGALEWQCPMDVKVFEANGTPRDIVEFSSKSFSAVTTRDHRWLVTDKRSGKNVCRQSHEISIHGDHRIHRTGKYEAGVVGTYTDDFVELVGWVLTDGSYERRGGSTRIRIYQSKVSTVREIDTLFSRWPRLGRRGKNRGLTTWGFTGETARRIRELFPDRTLTEAFLLTLTSPQLRLLLDTMMKGDGHRNERTDHLFTGREAQARAFQMLCVLCGLSSRMHYRDMSKYEPKSKKLSNVPKMTGVWIVSILRRDKVQVTAKQKRVYKADIGVWCPMLPNTYFVARRRGFTFITGNTLFQGRTSDAFKRAIRFSTREAWTGRWYYPPQNEDEERRKRNGEPSPLFGARLLIPMHDEIVGEAPDPQNDVTRAGRCAERLAYVMRSAGQEVTPDVPSLCGAVLTRNWFKGSKAVRVDGVLRPSKPLKVMVDGKEKTKWVLDENQPMRAAA